MEMSYWLVAGLSLAWFALGVLTGRSFPTRGHGLEREGGSMTRSRHLPRKYDQPLEYKIWTPLHAENPLSGELVYTSSKPTSPAVNSQKPL